MKQISRLHKKSFEKLEGFFREKRDIESYEKEIFSKLQDLRERKEALEKDLEQAKAQYEDLLDAFATTGKLNLSHHSLYFSLRIGSIEDFRSYLYSILHLLGFDPYIEQGIIYIGQDNPHDIAAKIFVEHLIK